MTRLTLVFLLCALAAFGQIGTSTITGRVTDPSGAVVPNVSVTVVNTGTNFQFMAQTNSDGLFRVQSLQPGPYRLTFEAAGFTDVKSYGGLGREPFALGSPGLWLVGTRP